MGKFWIAVYAALFHVSAAGAFAAGPAVKTDWDACAQTTDLDRKIAACSAIIARGDALGREERSRALAFRANGHSAKGAHDQAVSDAGEAIRLDARNVVAFVNRGAAQIARGEPAAAIPDLSEAIRLDPDNATAYSNRGVAYTRVNEYDRAIRDFDEAIRLNPRLPNPYRHRGAAYRGKGAYDQSLKDFEQALQINPNYADALVGRAETYAAKGEHQRALVDYEVALRVATAYDQERARRAAEAGVRTERVAVAGRQTIVAAGSPRNETRIALVIGNSSYVAHRALKNPKRDAEAIAEVLRGSGFDVTLALDLGRTPLLEALNKFADRAQRSDWAMIYFAGHGIEVDRVNYVIPVDARLKHDRDVQDEAVSLPRILEAVEQARRLRLVVLDACRNNPFVSEMETTRTTRSIGRGLARVEPNVGTLVAYAAKHGQVAEDGEEGENSPFAAALVERLAEPDLEVGMLFRHVRDDVLRATGSQQEPFVYGSLPGDTFYFRQAAN